MPQVLLVRHAQSEANLAQEKMWTGSSGGLADYLLEAKRAFNHDPDLSPKGRQQAEALARAFAPSFSDLGERALLVSSPMRRALQTAMPMAQQAKLESRQFLCHAELFEVGSRLYRHNTRPSQFAAQLETEYQLRCCEVPSDESYARREKGESANEARARIDRVVKWADTTLGGHEHELIVVIAHGHLITRWLRHWAGAPWGHGLAFVHGNAGVTMVDWDRDEGIVLESVNDQSHLPEALRSGGNGNWRAYALPDVEIERYEGCAEMPEVIAKQLRAMVPELEKHDKHRVHFVAFVEGELAGHAAYERETGRLRQLLVSPARRRARLGRRLVSAVEREAADDLLSELAVHAPAETLEFFEALGFEARAEVAGAESHREMLKPISTR